MSGAAYFSMLVVWLVAVLPRQRCRRRRRTQFLGWKVQSNLSFIFSCFQATNICQEKHMKQATDGSSSSISLKNWKCVNDNYLFPSSFSLLFFCLSFSLWCLHKELLCRIIVRQLQLKSCDDWPPFLLLALFMDFFLFDKYPSPRNIRTVIAVFLMGWRYTANWKTLNLSYARLKSFY